MAKEYKNKNSNNQKRNVYRIISIVSIPLSFLVFVGCMFIHLELPGLGFLVIGFYVSRFTSIQYRKLNAGLEGEKRAQDILRHLSNRYTVIHNLQIEFEGKHSEVDSLVISQQGVFIVEVKNHVGVITGNAKDETWVQDHHGNKRDMKNPLKQLNYQRYIVSSILKENGIYILVDGCILMPSAQFVYVDSHKIVMNEDDLLKMIQSKKTILSKEDMNRIIKVLK